jgi:hypothetical protein
LTVGVPGTQQGQLLQIVTELDKAGDDAAEVTFTHSSARINADLTTGSDVGSTDILEANIGLSNRGVTILGDGFVLDAEVARGFLERGDEALHAHIRPLINGRDITAHLRGQWVIDLYGLTEEDVKARFPEVYQWVFDRVRPLRMENARAGYRDKWWVFGEPRGSFRPALRGLSRCIITPMTAKHRLFIFAGSETVADQGLIIVGLEDAYHLGVLSSRVHLEWALASGGTLEDRPRYNNSRCFETFPFPACTPAQQASIGALGEQLDAHRKRQQALHPELTMTGMYNVLESVRAGTTLTAKEKKVYEQGLVGILKQLHDELDAAVADAYGWPASLSTDEILTRLVALNAERAAEEAQGNIRWLRPEYQAPTATTAPTGKQAKLDVDDETTATIAPAALRTWPSELPAQVSALSEVLGGLAAPASVEAIASFFEGKKSKKRLEEMERLLETLRVLGLAGVGDGGWSSIS